MQGMRFIDELKRLIPLEIQRVIGVSHGEARHL